uniref:hypothetical protein n=1 Tax=Lachnoclostridium phocaeense TaxID=1871021 RepID=UPI0026DC66B4|nr:hypothetical protein [Lachnoclostridium phocaeense]
MNIIRPVKIHGAPSGSAVDLFEQKWQSDYKKVTIILERTGCGLYNIYNTAYGEIQKNQREGK